MQVSELLRKYIDIIQNEDVPPVSAKNWQDDPNTLDQKLSPTADLNDPNKADAKGKIVGRNRQLAYMQPLDKDGDLNVSLGLGKPQMRNLHGKGQRYRGAQCRVRLGPGPLRLPLRQTICPVGPRRPRSVARHSLGPSLP
jgi:hypothetical protein